MKNIYLIVGSWLALFAVVSVGVVAVAAPYVPPKTFAPGDPILSSDFNTMNSTLAASINNVTAAQITDSTITSGKVSATFFSGSVRRSNNAIDTGAISFDTQFHPSWYLPTARLISSTDSAQNFGKTLSGYYMGNGQDTRTIYNTVQYGANQSAYGVNIPFTVTRVTVRGLDWGGSNFYVHTFETNDAISDSFCVQIRTDNNGGGVYWGQADGVAITSADCGLTWSPGGYNSIVNTSDSHGFRVRNTSSSEYSANEAGRRYVWTVSGY